MAEIKRLRRRRRRATKRLTRNQRWRQRARKLRKPMRRNKGLGKLLERLLNALAKRITHLHGELREIEREIEREKKRQDGSRQAYVRWLKSVVGMQEGSSQQVKIAHDIGANPSWPWCSTLAAYGLIHHGGFRRGDLPANPWYSGAWLSWDHGTRVSYSEVQPGDLLIFDWGDGGITDHVATYVADGKKIGGNENDRVEWDAVPTSAIVGVVRPNWP